MIFVANTRLIDVLTWEFVSVSLISWRSSVGVEPRAYCGAVEARKTKVIKTKDVLFTLRIRGAGDFFLK